MRGHEDTYPYGAEEDGKICNTLLCRNVDRHQENVANKAGAKSTNQVESSLLEMVRGIADHQQCASRSDGRSHSILSNVS